MRARARACVYVCVSGCVNGWVGRRARTDKKLTLTVQSCTVWTKRDGVGPVGRYAEEPRLTEPVSRVHTVTCHQPTEHTAKPAFSSSRHSHSALPKKKNQHRPTVCCPPAILLHCILSGHGDPTHPASVLLPLLSWCLMSAETLRLISDGEGWRKKVGGKGGGGVEKKSGVGEGGTEREGLPPHRGWVFPTCITVIAPVLIHPLRQAANRLRAQVGRHRRGQCRGNWHTLKTFATDAACQSPVSIARARVRACAMSPLRP